MTAIIVALGIAGVVWGTLLAIRGNLVFGCALYLVAASCFGGHFYSFDAVGLTWTLDRFFLFALVAAYLIQTRVGRTQPKPVGRGELVLSGFFGLLIFSTFTHDWHSKGPDDVPVFMHLVNGYLIPLTIFWIARQAALTERGVYLMYTAIACFGVYLAATAIFEHFKIWSLVFPKYIADPTVGIHFGRSRGPMVQSARFGTYLVICLATTWIAWGWLGKLGTKGRFIALSVLPLYGAAIYFTYTRSVWLGAAISMVVILGLTLRGKPRLVVLGGMCAAALLVVVAKGDKLVAFKREYTAQETRASTYMRASFAYVSWQMFQDRPLVGFGFGQFPRENQHYLSDRTTNLRLESIRGYVHHNTLLSVLVELGIFGLALFLAVLTYWGYSAWKLWHDNSAPKWMRAHGLLCLTAMAPYACQLVFRDVSFSPVENACIFMFAGITVGLRVTLARNNSLVFRQTVGMQRHPATC